MGVRLKGRCHALTQVLGPLFPPFLCQLVSLSCLLYVLTKGIRRDLAQEVPLKGETASGPCPQASCPHLFHLLQSQETPSGGFTQGWDWALDKGHHTYLAWWEGCRRRVLLAGMAGCSFEEAWHPVGPWLVGWVPWSSLRRKGTLLAGGLA